jgi:hypothetical protein
MPCILYTFDQVLRNNTSHVRKIIFDILAPFSLNTANHKLFWPLIDNIYSIRYSSDVKKPRPHKYYYIIKA